MSSLSLGMFISAIMVVGIWVCLVIHSLNNITDRIWHVVLELRKHNEREAGDE